jgi:hypothetical protein
MDACTPATHIPGLSRARLKRVIAAGNVAAVAIALWAFLVPTLLYTLGSAFYFRFGVSPLRCVREARSDLKRRGAASLPFPGTPLATAGKDPET